MKKWLILFGVFGVCAIVVSQTATIIDLTEETTPAGGDSLMIWDASAPAGTRTKRATIANVSKGIDLDNVSTGTLPTDRIEDDAITASKIATDEVGVDEINDTDTPNDEECLTFEATGNLFEWQACGSGTTNLSNTPSGTEVTVESDTGTDTSIAGATGSLAGVMVAADKSKLDGVEAGADITDTANVTAAGALMDSEVDADIKTLSLPASVSISAYMATVLDDASAAAARTTLDVDQAGTDNSVNVTLAGAPDYITIIGQVITRAQIDLAADVTGELPTANIADSAVTNAKLADMAQDTIKCRVSSGTGAPEDCTAAQAKSVLAIVEADISDLAHTATAITDDIIVAADFADADHGDISWASNVASIDAGVVDSAEIATDAIGTSELDLTIAPAWTGDHDYGAAGIEIENSTTVPGSCTVGQIFLDTDATSGQQLYACEGGSFVLQGDGGGGSHASTHIDGGADAIDGDQLEITATFENFTPDSSIAEADSTDDLAAILEGIDDQLAFVPQSEISFSVHKGGTDQTTTSGAFVKVTWSTELFDNGGDNFDLTNERFVAPKDGRYIFGSNVHNNHVDNTNDAIIAIYVNGSLHQYGNRIPGSNVDSVLAHNITTIIDLVTDDYVEIFSYAIEVGNPDVEGDADKTYFWGYYLDEGGSQLAISERTCAATIDGLTWTSGIESEDICYWLEGQRLHFQGAIEASGAVTAANLEIDLPGGYSYDTTGITVNAGSTLAGEFSFLDTGTEILHGRIVYVDTDSIGFRYFADGGTEETATQLSNSAPVTIADGDRIEFQGSVPITGAAINANVDPDNLVIDAITLDNITADAGHASCDATDRLCAVLEGIDDALGSSAGAPFVDTTSIVEGSADATKEIRIEVDGLTTATVRVWTAPDQNLDFTPGTGDFATAAEGDLAATALQDVIDDSTPQLGGDLDGEGNNLTDSGVIFLREQAEADADVAGQGQIWINTATPNELYFTDDAGTDQEIANVADLAAQDECSEITNCVPSAILATDVTYENLSTNSDIGFGAAQVPQGSLTAPLASPALTGNPTAPTAAGEDNDTSIATTAYVQAEVQEQDACSEITGCIENALQNIVEDTTPQLGGDLDGEGNNIIDSGVIFLREQADADADVAGQGQIWVNTATPNELYFTDDAGTDHELEFTGHSHTESDISDLDHTATAITDDLIVAADFADADWGDGSISTNVFSLDVNVVDSAEIATDAVGTDELDLAVAPAWTGDHDFGSAGIEIENSTTVPGSCTAGQIFMDTDATSGQQLYGCESGSFVLQGDGGGGMGNVVEDTTPQLGGQLDVNGNAIGDGTLELLTFVEDGSAVNHIEIENEATGSGSILRATGDDATVELNLDTKGTADVNVLDNLDVTGNIVVSGTVDGRDLATDGTKLDAIEASADVTDATNVNAAGAVMHTDIGSNGMVARTASETYAQRTITGTANEIEITDGDGVSGNPTIGLPNDVTIGNDLTVTGDVLADRDFAVTVTNPAGDDIAVGDDQMYFPIPSRFNTWELITVVGLVTTQSSSGAIDVDLTRDRGGSQVDMLSTNLTIDANERSSTSAAAAAVINTSNDDLATDDFIIVDVDGAGTGAKGLMLIFTFSPP